MHPRGGGFGIHNETTDEPELREQAIALLRSLNWHGPALLEFRVDPETGAAHFIELNARYWGTLDLAIQAGIDFPTLACRMAVEGDVEPAFDYEVGLRYRWRIPHGLRQVVGGPARAAAFRELFLPRARTCSDVEWSDPLPLLVKMLRAAGTLGGG
jgi:predicted ATP-grasp superfamily ATP-dependent carboligase